MLFAIILASVLGIIGLGTEVGVWYVRRTMAFNAADAAATAGALASLQGDDAAGAARDILSRNGFSAATVTVNIPPDWSNPDNAAAYANNSTATQVIVSIPVSSLLVGAFTGHAAITVTGKSVAAIIPIGNACVLSLKGNLLINQNQSESMGGYYCYYASNATESTTPDKAVEITNGATVAFLGITTTGDCLNCAPIESQPANPDPNNPSIATSVLTDGYDSAGGLQYRPVSA